MSEIIDRVVLGSCRFTGTNLEQGTPGHLVFDGVQHSHVEALEACISEVIFMRRIDRPKRALARTDARAHAHVGNGQRTDTGKMGAEGVQG